MIKRILLATAVLYYYFVHMTILRLIGPRAAILGSRLFAWFHWALMFVGFERRARLALSQVLPRIRPDLSLNAVVRRYIAVKHQHYLEWALYPTRRGRRYVAQTYERVQGREHLDAALSAGKGAIVLVSHFGMYRMACVVITHAGYPLYPHSYRESTYAETTFAWVAHITKQWWIRADKAAGLNVVYHRPFFTFEVLARLLSRQNVVGLAAEGMGATEFADIPFLGGTLRLPTGPARLAARTGASIVPVFGLLEGLYKHQVVIHPAIHCGADSGPSTEAAMIAYAQVLEEYVRQDPGAWSVWHRLNVDAKADGRLHLSFKVWSPAGPTAVAPRAHNAAVTLRTR